MAGRRKANDEEAREHERRAWELRCRGWTHERIAAEIGVERSTVTKALARVEQRVLADLKDEVARRKVTQTAQLDHVYDEMMQAWERSKLPAKTARKQSGGDGGADRLTQEVEEQVGDAGYVDRAMGALAEVRKIWGVDEATKRELSGPGGKPLAFITAVEVVEPPAEGVPRAD